MATSVQNPEDVVNVALKRIGWKLRVGSLFDGSDAARAAIDIYGQTRDDLLAEEDWDFARRDVILTLLKMAPAGGYIPPNVWNGAVNPPIPYLFEYQYPADAIRIRSLKPTPLFVPNFFPTANAITLANDNYYSPAQKVILCNVPGAIAVYTGRVTDPTTWKPGFVEALAAALARRLAPVLGNLDLEKIEAQDEQLQTEVGYEMERG